jgi:excisionase family DNA binding protein
MTTDATAAQPSLGRRIETSTYTVEQIAGMLQCSERHVWRLADANKIPGKLRIGRLVRFSRQLVDAWLAGQASPTR